MIAKAFSHFVEKPLPNHKLDLNGTLYWCRLNFTQITIDLGEHIFPYQLFFCHVESHEQDIC
jgi:hypothetical protein